MGRPPLEIKQRQMAVAMPPHLRERLEQAASAAQHSVAEEIRQRLEQTFDAERLDKPTRDLQFTIKHLAELVRIQTGSDWHVHSDAWQVFRQAISTGLDRLRPTAAAHPATPAAAARPNPPARAGKDEPLPRQLRDALAVQSHDLTPCPFENGAVPLVSSHDPETIGAGIEAIVFMRQKAMRDLIAAQLIAIKKDSEKP
jgi:hypothetical protein